MNIGIDIRSLAEGKITGVEMYTVNLLKHLFLQDPHNQYILFYNALSGQPALLPELHFSNVRLKRFYFPNRLLNASLKFLAYPKIDELLGGADIFFSPRFLFLALSSRCRLVITTHDLSFITHPEFFSRKQRLWHLLVSDRRASRAADRIIAVSESTKRDVVDLFGIKSEKIAVIYPGIDHGIYNTARDAALERAIRQKYQLSHDYILHLATVEPRKNLLGVIDAYERLRRTRKEPIDLVSAGGLGWLYKKILQRRYSSPFRQDIKLLTAIPEADKPALYRMARVFVFPSFYEGFGFPPLEAMACGVPVVAAMNSSFPEVLADAALYVAPYNSESIHRAVSHILSDERLSGVLRQRGLMQARRFSWAAAAAHTLKVFNTLTKHYA